MKDGGSVKLARIHSINIITTCSLNSFLDYGIRNGGHFTYSRVLSLRLMRFLVVMRYFFYFIVVLFEDKTYAKHLALNLFEVSKYRVN